VDCAKQFYKCLGRWEGADIVGGPTFRIVQFTPPGVGVLDQLRHGRHHDVSRVAAGAAARRRDIQAACDARQTMTNDVVPWPR
jgi:hypothetical protein